MPGFLRCNQALVQLFLHEGMIFGQLLQGVVAQPVGSRIPHMADDEAVTGEGQQFGGASHAMVGRIAFHMLEDLVIGQFEGRLHPRDGIFLGLPVVAGEYRIGSLGENAAGHLAGSGTAHAVGDQAIVAPFADIKNVFIVGADVSHIRISGVGDFR